LDRAKAMAGSVLPTDYSARRRGELVSSLLRSKIALVGLFCVLLVMAVALGAPWMTSQDPSRISVKDRLKPPAWVEKGSSLHPLGTDGLGRDLFSQVVYGSRISLLVGFSSVILAGLLGVTLGLISGYYGGRLDTVLMRVADIQSAFPFILLAITLMATLGPGLVNIIITLGVTGWVEYARMVRGQVFSLREKEFVEAARCAGVPNWLILIRHILPNTVAPVIVVASFAVSSNIIAEAGLSFLGLGVPLSIPSWGGMLSQALEVISRAWWPSVFPGLAITITVFGVNVVGDWLRDYLDPQLRGR
jgi:peptide/nickel transport system permease protein